MLIELEAEKDSTNKAYQGKREEYLQARNRMAEVKYMEAKAKFLPIAAEFVASKRICGYGYDAELEVSLDDSLIEVAQQLIINEITD
jgi:hypothetical protein